MIELLKAYETANNEKNKFLRKIYIFYVRKRLKKLFFDKYDISRIKINYTYLCEFFQFYNCTKDSVNIESINNRYPKLIDCDTENQKITICYMDYVLKFTVIQESRYALDIIPPYYSNDYDNSNTINLYINDETLKRSFFAEIINMVIYNYCVGYIYGNKGHYLFNNEYLYNLEKYFI